MVAQAVLIPVGPTAAAKKVSGGTAIQAGSEVIAESTGAAVLYGTNLPHPNEVNYYAKVFGDASTVAWTSTNIPCLAYADYQVTITAANLLRVNCLVNGVPIIRVGSGATPGAGEFKVAESGGVVTLTVGSTYAAGTKIEFVIRDAADITTASALTANTPAEKEAFDLMTAGVAAAVIYC